MKSFYFSNVVFAVLGLLILGLFSSVAYADDAVRHVNRLHQSLDNFTMEEKANSIITLALPGEVAPGDNPLIGKFESEWNSGQYDMAMHTIDMLGQSLDVTNIGFDVEWKIPIPTTQSPTLYECARVGNRDSIYVTEYDIDRSSGNIMAVLALQGDGYGTVATMNFSDDDGATWVETHYYQSANVILDVDCAVYDGYCIVALVTDYNYIIARRFSMADGSFMQFPSGAFGVEIAYNHIFWDEIALVSIQDIDNHDAYSDKFYLAANRTTGELYLFKAGADAETWSSYSGGYSDVGNGLDICFNETDGDIIYGFNVYMSYLTADEDLRIVGWHSSIGWGSLHQNTENASDALFTSIDAYENNIYCVYEAIYSSTRTAKICRTNNGGGSWSTLHLDDLSYNRYCPDVTARSGGGLGIAYRKDGAMSLIGGRIQWGDYDFNPFNGPVIAYSSPAHNVRPCIELLNSGYYGVLNVKKALMVTPQAYFCTEGYCCDTPGDANSDFACNVGDAVYLINYVFKGGPGPACMPAGDANDDGAVNVGDAVYIINYAFKGGPAPTCSG